jgi:hypothetical protein
MAMELHSTASQVPKQFIGMQTDDYSLKPHLFTAHRLYIWAYEKALREECAYTGYQPYWNWARYAEDPINSPLFNGNDSSMGGNGLPSIYPGIPSMGFKEPYDMIPSAGGGGCVTTGPFKEYNFLRHTLHPGASATNML